MINFLEDVQLRWSDLDPNLHVRHSVYYDWGALCRVEFFDKHGLTIETMAKLNTGFILFREECVFKKEIRKGDKIKIDIQILESKKDFSRVSIRHHIYKNENILSAILTVDGAWINIKERKLSAPPEMIHNIFDHAPKHENFRWL
jgi:acyl-CoA thioester hydrolase